MARRKCEDTRNRPVKLAPDSRHARIVEGDRVMQRYTGELVTDDERSQVPMLFDGWGYVPLDVAAARGTPVEPNSKKRSLVGAKAPAAR
jgi:hypothetical protein